ncbi:hypothetical protein CEP54_007272 [Fusarium duplospermum]|uniref:T6SS Phospholipase effector Tle1-like catalytic domain-containing protein n=1 Tax=Fusarium duplospermum TaxID=1325734 RepID=A0A428Q204_9HYPO|nr:hypothetical protein CEP54_007272 [Fusarium duplospermum]
MSSKNDSELAPLTLFRYQYSSLPITLSSSECAGKIFIITGANSGLGFECVKHLVTLGCKKVVMAVRSRQRGLDALALVESETGVKGVAEIWELDVGNFDSVERFATKVEADLERVDGLINNAAAADGSWTIVEGMESNIAINLVGTILLTVRKSLCILATSLYALTALPTLSFGNLLNKYQQGTGKEIERSIIESYTFLCDNYNRGDEIFLIGFSRGAFAARCLADLVHQRGVLPKKKLDDIHEVYQDWNDPTKRCQNPLPANLRGRDARITACALWDTVGAVGIPLTKTILSRGIPFVHSDIPGSIKNVFQAIALHEPRHHFFPIVLRHPAQGRDPNTHLEQCWFGGYHADVGGGNEKDAMAHFALVWIMSKLKKWINFDIDNLSDRSSRMITWKVGGPAGGQQVGDSYRLPVPDSMGLFFKTGGSKYRIPRTEFWNESGVYERGTNHDIISGEEMHPTARYLVQARLVTKFHSAERLAPAQPHQNDDQSWIWSLRTRAESWLWRRRSDYHWWLDRRVPRWLGFPVQNGQGGNNIDEAIFDNFEKETLMAWVQADLEALHDEDNPAGAPRPNTILLNLKEWLRDHTREPPPFPQRQGMSSS